MTILTVLLLLSSLRQLGHESPLHGVPVNSQIAPIPAAELSWAVRESSNPNTAQLSNLQLTYVLLSTLTINYPRHGATKGKTGLLFSVSLRAVPVPILLVLSWQLFSIFICYRTYF